MSELELSSLVLPWPPIIEALREVIGAADSPAYLVGGAVRDAFLRRPLHDLDFATPDDGRKLAKRIADRFHGAYYPLDAERGVGRAIVEYQDERFVIDIAQFRGASLADDLIGRDFTINALAVPMSGDLQQVIDVVGSVTDLQNKRLRRCSPQSIADDPVRALRAIRQSVALNLRIEPETRADLRTYGPNITASSPERMRDEFMNMLGGVKPHAALRTLDALGLLRLIVPEVDAMRGVAQSPPHVFDVWEHTLNVVERLAGVIGTISPARTEESAADSAYGMIVYLLDRHRHPLQNYLDTAWPNGRSMQSLLMLAALLHDSAKPATRSIDEQGRIHFYQHEIVGADLTAERATALRLSTAEVTRASDVVRYHMRPMQLNIQTGESSAYDGRNNGSAVTDSGPVLSRRAVHRFWKATGEAGVGVCILTLADYLGMVGVTLVLQDWIHHLQIVDALLDGYFNQKEIVVAPPPLVSGHDLMTVLKLDPGPRVGLLLNAIVEAQAAGEVSTVDEALALAETMLGTLDTDHL